MDRLAGPNPPYYATETYRYLVFSDPAWSAAVRPINFDSDFTQAKERAGVIDADNANLKPFFERGGKIIASAGWSDPLISPLNSVNLYNKVAATVGAAETDRAYRLFMVPGMTHCGGGEGTDTFDMLPVLERWVEHGQVPTRGGIADGQGSHAANATSVPRPADRTVERPGEYQRRGQLHVRTSRIRSDYALIVHSIPGLTGRPVAA